MTMSLQDVKSLWEATWTAFYCQYYGEVFRRELWQIFFSAKWPDFDDGCFIYLQHAACHHANLNVALCWVSKFLPFSQTHQNLQEVRDACSPGRASDRNKPLPGDLMAGLGRAKLLLWLAACWLHRCFNGEGSAKKWSKDALKLCFSWIIFWGDW